MQLEHQAHPRLKEDRCKDIGAPARQFPLEVPAINPSRASIPSSCNNGVIPLLLCFYEVCDVLGLHRLTQVSGSDFKGSNHSKCRNAIQAVGSNSLWSLQTNQGPHVNGLMQVSKSTM